MYPGYRKRNFSKMLSRVPEILENSDLLFTTGRKETNTMVNTSVHTVLALRMRHKRCYHVHRFTVDERKISLFLEISGYMWTEP